jgi:hypothetical protein
MFGRNREQIGIWDQQAVEGDRIKEGWGEIITQK